MLNPPLHLAPEVQHALLAASVKRARRPAGAPRRVVFVVHAPETFCALEPVVRQMQQQPERFDLFFLAVPRNYTGVAQAAYEGGERTWSYLRGLGLRAMPMQGDTAQDLVRLIQLEPDFLFRQSPWDADVPAAFRTPALGFTQLCYVPYGMATVDKPQFQYNQLFHNQCDWIFAESEFHLQEFAAHRDMGARGVHLTGHPRFEYLLARFEQASAAWPLAVGEDVPRLVWAPHHSVGRAWLNYSTFMMHKDAMLAQARRGRISVLFRPHPALREQLVAQGAMAASAYDAYLAAFDELGSSGVDRELDYVEQFAASDLLVTDGLGFFSEYLLTGKPLVRTWKAGAEPMNPFGNWCAEAARVVDGGQALQALLDEVAAHRYVDNEMALRLERREVLAAMCSGASQRIVEVLAAA